LQKLRRLLGGKCNADLRSRRVLGVEGQGRFSPSPFRERVGVRGYPCPALNANWYKGSHDHRTLEFARLQAFSSKSDCWRSYACVFEVLRPYGMLSEMSGIYFAGWKPALPDNMAIPRERGLPARKVLKLSFARGSSDIIIRRKLPMRPLRVISVHPETPDVTHTVSNSERRHFSSWRVQPCEPPNAIGQRRTVGG